MDMSNPARSTPRLPTVYVVQDDPSRNMTSAMDFGNLEAVLQPHEEVTMLNSRWVVGVMKYRLRHFQPHDYLILVGNPVAIGIACAIASEITGGTFNVLKWDAQEKRYWPAQIDLSIPPLDAEMRSGRSSG